MRLVFDDRLNRRLIGQQPTLPYAFRSVANPVEPFFQFGKLRRLRSYSFIFIKIIAERLANLLNRRSLGAVAWDILVVERDDELGENFIMIELRCDDLEPNHAIEPPQIHRGAFCVKRFELTDGIQTLNDGIAVLDPILERFKSRDHGIGRE